MDDSFAEKILQRTKARKDFISEKKKEATLLSKKRPVLDEQKINPDEPPEESPKRQCIQAQQNTYSTYNKENIEIQSEASSNAFIPIHASSKVKGLAALKKNFNEIDDYEEMETSKPQGTSTSAGSVKNPTIEIQQKEKIMQEIKNFNNHSENEDSDDESIDENDFAENYDEINSEHKNNCNMESDYSSVVSGAKYDHQQKKQEQIKKITPASEDLVSRNVDPAELPLAARKALFEKALLGGSSKSNVNFVEQKLSVAERASIFENAAKLHSLPKKTPVFKESKQINPPNVLQSKTNQLAKSPVKSIQPVMTPVSHTVSPVKKPSVPGPTPSPSKNIGNNIWTIQQKLYENSAKCQGETINKIVEERKKEISNLVNHWEKQSSSSSTENNSKAKYLASEEQYSTESDSQDEYFEYDEESYSKSMDDNDDEKYESCSDASEVENVFEDQTLDTESTTNLEENEENYTYEQHVSNENYTYEQHVSNEDSQLSNYQDHRNSPKSFPQSFPQSDGANHKVIRNDDFPSDNTSSAKSEITVPNDNATANENKNLDAPLMYTVSFYRKQKQETRLTPVRTIVRREKVSSPESPDKDYTQVIQERIKSLHEEVLRQQTVISQTSQALNLCSATTEFSGSTEQVEGERLLLIATQKRQACLNEIQRLKMCGSQGESIGDGTGTLIITDIQLPLKREFMASELQGKGGDIVHYFLCLIRHGAQVIVTQMMSTNDRVADGALCFTNHIKLQNLTADFSVVFEVYALQTKKEQLPHEKKYHIKREHSRIRLTPKGKKSDGKILMPAISSPGGPNAVRSPSFGVVGYTRFNLQNCKKHIFTLDKVPFSSPLDGILKVKLQLHAEHKIMEKGFLTMFEDVSGFGAWQRRWCVLDGHEIVYWKYPDDEQRKEPMGVIDLKQCVTEHVKLAPRDICARPHTFQLITVRPQAKGDKNTLISKSVNTLTSTKHLLSADTKEERILWCNKLNEALTNVRKWDPQALRPLETMQEHLQF